MAHKQTKEQLEQLVAALRSEARQNEIIGASKRAEMEMMKKEIDRLTRDLQWTKQVVQSLATTLEKRYG